MKRLLLFILVLAAGLVSSRAQVLISRDADYQVRGDRVRIEADYIANYTTNKTGPLRFRLRATENRWFADEDLPPRGDVHTLALSPMPALAGGTVVVDSEEHETIAPKVRRRVHRTVDLSEPAGGSWFVTLTLEERYTDIDGKKRWRVLDVYPVGWDFFGGTP
jgi:hypothetical protein